jgi:hypothetical protein
MTGRERERQTSLHWFKKRFWNFVLALSILFVLAGWEGMGIFWRRMVDLWVVADEGDVCVGLDICVRVYKGERGGGGVREGWEVTIFFTTIYSCIPPECL